MKKFSIAPLILAPFLACGGGGSTKVTVDGHTGSGSGSGSGSAAPCTIASTIGSDFGSNQFAIWDNGSGSSTAAPGVFEEWGAEVNADPDVFFLDLYKGYGALTAGITAGTYQITGDDAQNKSCGVCAILVGNAVINSQGQITSGDNYLATSGVVTISSVGGAGTGSGSARTYGTLAASFQNVKFEHVNIGSDGTSTVVGDCTGTLAAGAFSKTIQYGGSNATPPVAPAAAPALHVHWDRDGLALRHRHI